MRPASAASDRRFHAANHRRLDRICYFASSLLSSLRFEPARYSTLSSSAVRAMRSDGPLKHHGSHVRQGEVSILPDK